jgi:hypothetical protein
VPVGSAAVNVIVQDGATVLSLLHVAAQFGITNNANENARNARIRLAMTGPPWVSESFTGKVGVREAGRSESNGRAFETAHRQRRDDFCRQFVVTHIFETFQVSRRKNGKNAAKTVIRGLAIRLYFRVVAAFEWPAPRFARRRTDKFH